MKAVIAFWIALTGSQAMADETPIFVSCYGNNGAQMTLAFDTAQTRLTYRYQNGDQVVYFESSPQGHFGPANSQVSKAIADNHKVLMAHIVAGNAEQPTIDADAELIFDRDNTGALRLTSGSLYYQSQAIGLAEFQEPGACYVQ